MQNTGLQGSTPGATGPDATEQATSKLSQLTDSAQHTIERLSHAAADTASRLGERTHELWDAQGPNIEKARVYMREHPIATIAIAIGIGLVLSKLLSRR
ncbi:MAG TPA: hypothetical protein VED01_23665 [Burkholderiales bacterium]|nr:hypothetical protein [Burkholderiales bacterium]